MTEPEPEPTPSTIERTVHLEATPDDAWQLLTDPTELAGWLGDPVDLALTPGRLGRLVVDGDERRVVVDTVDEARLLRFTWWSDADPAAASTVTFTLDADEGGSRLTVVEAPVLRAGPVCHVLEASAAAGDPDDPWTRALLSLEVRSFLAARRFASVTA
jgi:uncharacterized protein YndB with AHSA1/START domain